jgi:adenylate cyclase
MSSEKTFAFVDLAGFSALTETHGDDAAADLVGHFEGMVRASLGFGDELVGMIGDAAFLAFPGPTAALGLLRRLWNRANAESDFPTLRAGVHHGEAASRDGNYFGTAVNVAARVAGEARGGQIVGSATVIEAARAAEFRVQSLGVVRLKNLRQSLELFSLESEPGSSPEVVDPVCRMRVIPERAEAHLELAGNEYWFCSRACLQLFLEENGR